MGTIAEKLSYLNNTKQLLKDGINDLGGNIDDETTFREYVNNLTEIYNEYPKVSDTGTEINLTNTKQGKLTTELNPSETSQESTTGKNILPINKIETQTINGLTFTNLGDGTIKINGTANTTTRVFVDINQSLLANTEYKFENFNTRGSGANIGILDANEELINNIILNANTKVFTLSSDKTATKLRFYTDSGQVFDNYILKVMLINSGDNENWEPYTNGPAPNPDYPFPIHTVSGENNIKIENKNLINFGTQSFTTFYQQTDLNIPAGTYTLSALITSSDTTNTYSRAYFYSASSTSLGVVNLDRNTRASKTITLTDIATRLVIYSSIDYSSSNGKTATWKDIMLEQGSAATEYTPHQEQNYVIHLGDLEYCKIGDYKDQIFKNTINSPYYDSTLNENEWYMKKNIKKIVLDGTENWVLNSNYQVKYRYTLELNDLIYYDNNDGTEVSALSDYFKGVPTNEWSTTVNSLTIISNKRLLISSEINNVTDFKTWLITHNTIVYYVLNTSEYINITQNYPTLATQLETLKNNAKSYNDETNISQTNNDLPFDITAYALEKGA